MYGDGLDVSNNINPCNETLDRYYIVQRVYTSANEISSTTRRFIGEDPIICVHASLQPLSRPDVEVLCTTRNEHEVLYLKNLEATLRRQANKNLTT